jgi:hypothetical protein
LADTIMTFRNAFLEWATTRFPTLAERMNGETRGMRVHLAFEHFRNATQDAIDGKRTKEVVELFQMADRVLANAFPAMRSLFHVVYVEHLLFDDRTHERSWAIDVLTPRLKKDFVASMGCCEEVRRRLN